MHSCSCLHSKHTLTLIGSPLQLAFKLTSWYNCSSYLNLMINFTLFIVNQMAAQELSG